MSDADKYTTVSEIEHILLRPGMYIGTAEPVVESMFIVDDDEQIINKSISYSPALERIFEEVLLNAFDHTIRDSTCTEIKVEIEDGYISIWNNGKGIPVILKPELNVYVPEMIFGMLRSGTNYDDSEERITGGMNGLGAKLTNVFSLEFTVETIDSDNKKYFSQTWSQNMSVKDKCVIKSDKKKSFTKIKFLPDLKRFKMNELSSDVIALMKKRVIDIAVCTSSKVKVYFNGSIINIKKYEDYMKLYNHPDNNSIIVDDSERWTIGVAFSNEGFKCASFVNGIHTNQNGSHVDSVLSEITSELIAKLKTKKIEVKPSDIKNKLFLFVRSAIVNPTFTSQTKECLKMPKSKFGSTYSMSDKFKKKLLTSDIYAAMTHVSNAKLEKELSKTSGSKSRRLNPPINGLEDANWAGTIKSDQTKLILTEGLSAKTFAMSAINVIGRDKYGIFPLKGKPLNVRSAGTLQISKNEEITNIVKIIGLKHGDKYTSSKSLRYGGIIILTDSDYDGYHISGLLINFVHYFFPELLELGFISICNTPIVKAYQNSKTIEFYTLNDYEKWLQTAKGNFKIKYFKGLGTSTPKEARECLTDIDKKIMTVKKDINCDNSINLAFNENLTDERKRWLMFDYDPETNVDRTQSMVTVSDFINKDLIHFSNYDNVRSLPNVMDGLKVSQRKIMHVALKYLHSNEMKVAQFGAKVAEKTDYHHGEASLMGAIINMAQNYVGSNNINLLAPKGGFGSRCSNGKDAASPRYIFTELTEIAKKIFMKIDNELLEKQQSDNMEIEPVWFAPIIPMILVNGSTGIGTGYSTSIPKYNPEELIKKLINKLKGKEVSFDLTPWYKGFSGEILFKKDKYVSYGVYEFIDQKFILRITELPIDQWTDPYKAFLETLCASKDWIKDVIYNNTDVVVSMDIHLTADKYKELKTMKKEDLIKLFKLSSSIGTTNMQAWNRHRYITKYDTAADIVDEYFTVRLNLYNDRKEMIIKKLEHELKILRNKVKFIKMVKNNEIDQKKLSESKLLTIMETEFDTEHATDSKNEIKSYTYLVDMPIRSLTNENQKKYQSLHDSKLIELETIKKISPEDMWITDLKDLAESYKQFVKS